jgi:arylsulfatase A-like enzyme
MSTRRRRFLQTLSGGAAGALVAAAPQGPAPRGAAAGKPNLLILMSDQHRAGLTRGSGYALDTMPALDRLAARGVSFDRAYTTAPVCVPARVSLLTGRWPHAHRVRQNSAGRFAYFEKDFFQLAREQGYRTGLTGKDHSHITATTGLLGAPPGVVDFFRGYEHRRGWTSDKAPKEVAEFDRWMMHENFRVSEVPTPFPVETQLPYRIVDNAIEFVDGTRDQPFALWVSFPEPHNPYQVPKPYFDMFPPASLAPRAVGPDALAAKGWKWQYLRKLEEETYPGYDEQWRRTRSNYLGMLRLIDDQVDRLLRHLESTSRLDHTIVVYLSDHGDYFCDYGLNRKGVGLPEALIRIPMMWAGPGIRPRQGHPAFTSTADVFPTLCEAIGTPMPHGVQGRSLWPLLQGASYPEAEFETVYSEGGFGGLHYDEHDEIPKTWGRIPGAEGAVPSFDELNPVTQSGTVKCVRRGDWKLIFDMMGTGELYNIAEDPYELKNLYGQAGAAEMQRRLTADLLAWTIRTQDDLPLAAYPHKWAARNWYRQNR